MRRWVGGLAVVSTVAALVALPSAATHQPIELRIVGTNRIELPRVQMSDNTTQPIRIDYLPTHPDGQGNVITCWQGRFDRGTLAARGGHASACSTREAGMNGATGDARTVQVFPTEPGRYEAVQLRLSPCELPCDPPAPPHWNVSNIVTFDVVDPCRLTAESFELVQGGALMMRGAPTSCANSIKGRIGLHGEDGSTIALSASGFINWTYLDNELRVPVFRVHADGSRASVAFRTGSRLGKMLTRASTPAATAISVAPSNVTLVHRSGVTTMRVGRGTVVVLRLHYLKAPQAIKRYCGRGRPTIACLSRIRYRFVLSGKIERARVLRAGQTAKFKRARGVAEPV